ncbi:MAG TPA: hypothetical protein VKB93_29450 [Thermoanaerobaculia bacterium]|nr:hypothetical protein [Thermoanaerobaculia bacterium]
MNPRRETLLLVAFAVWGLAIAISLAPALQRPAPADQLPGYATQIGIDAHGPFRFFALLIVVTLLTPLLARPLARGLAFAEAWAANATIAACVTAFWFVVLERNPFYVIAPFAIAIAAFTLLRRVPMHFTRRDWILLPTFLTTLLAVIDVVKDIQVQRATLVAAAIVLAIRIAVTFLPSPLPPALAFLLAPLGLALQTGFFARDQRYFGWHALLLVIVTPFVLRLVLRNERRAVKALAFVVYPIVVYAYTNAMSIATAEGKERLNFFEDSHSLPIASEYLRGEAPYRDNLPVHGLGADGGFEYLALGLGANPLRARAVLAALNSIAIYALGAAMTGVSEVGLVAFFFATLTGSTSSMLRATPALFTLLLIVLAIRKRDSRYLIAAGAGAVLCGVQGLDFGLYTFIVLLIAAIRMRAVRAAAIGLGAAAALLFGLFAVFGILDDFFRGTFREIVSMGPAYALNLFTPPRDLTTFPEFLPLAFRGDAFPYFVWCAIAIATAVLLARPRRRSREAFVIVGLFIVVCAISYAERHHLYFTDILAPLVIGGAYLAIRKRAAFAPALIIALVIAAMPTTHIGILGWVRRQRGPVEKGWVEVRDVPRARGALILDHEAKDLAAVKKYASLALKPNETWFDFTNRAIFYYLLNRDNPTRYVEVAYYQTEAAQREVIATLERNPHIRAALVPPGGTPVDGVPLELRTPLVWQYLQEHFTPDFAEGGVVFWRRR